MPIQLISKRNLDGTANVSMTIAAGESVQQPVILSSTDLTGYSAKMQISLPTPVILTTDNDGITIPDPTTGTLWINITDSASAAFTSGNYVNEFWLISAGGKSERLWSGSFTVLKSITTIP